MRLALLALLATACSSGPPPICNEAGQSTCDGHVGEGVTVEPDGTATGYFAACGNEWRARCDPAGLFIEHDVRVSTSACFRDGERVVADGEPAICLNDFGEPQCVAIPCDGEWHSGPGAS